MENRDAEKNFDIFSERLSKIESSSDEILLRVENAIKKLNEAVKRLEQEINQKSTYFRAGNLDAKNIRGTISQNLKNVGDIYNSKIGKTKQKDK